MSSKINTHYYDGKLRNHINEYSEEIKQAAGASKADKLRAFRELHKRLVSLRTPPRYLAMLTIIMRDYESKGRECRSNYDSTNGLYADDLVYICYKRTIVLLGASIN